MMIARTNKTNCTSTHSEKSITELFMPTSDNTKEKLIHAEVFYKRRTAAALFHRFTVLEP
jgi:hypothetical protein